MNCMFILKLDIIYIIMENNFFMSFKNIFEIFLFVININVYCLVVDLIFFEWFN